MCARESFLATPANQICCPSGRVGDVCRNQTADQPCRTNDALCASDVCVAGVCLAAKQPQLAVCESDTDCSNGVCAKANLTATGPQICCPDGTPKLDLSDQVNDVCRNQTVGQPCGLRNSLCASGVCVAGACLASKQLQLAPCESDVSMAFAVGRVILLLPILFAVPMVLPKWLMLTFSATLTTFVATSC